LEIYCDDHSLILATINLFSFLKKVKVVVKRI